MSLLLDLELPVDLVDPQVLGSPWDQESIEGQEDLGSQEDLGHPLVLAILWSGTLNTKRCHYCYHSRAKITSFRTGYITSLAYWSVCRLSE